MSLTETDVDKILAKVILKKLRDMRGFVIGRLISEKKKRYIYIWYHANNTQIIFLLMHTSPSTSMSRAYNVYASLSVSQWHYIQRSAS